MEYLETYLIRFVFLAVVAMPIVGWCTLPGRVRRGKISKMKASFFFSAATLLPTVLFAGLFFSLAGLEELTGKHYIGEGLGRSFLIVMVLGGLVWLLCSVLFFFMMFLIKSNADTARPGAAAERK